MTKRLTLVFLAVLSLACDRAGVQMPHQLDCVIDMKARDDTVRGFVTGYNYHLLEEFAADHSVSLSIRISRTPAEWTDSLIAGRVGLVAVPVGRTLNPKMLEYVACSDTVDNVSVWLVRRGETALLDSINLWIRDYHESDHFSVTSRKFLSPYDPIRRAEAGRTSSFLGPYDDIIKPAASSLGWDWRMLAAVIYQESRFNIRARSRRGATGLMQIMPSTVGMDEDELWSPKTNIDMGVACLKIIYRHFRYIEDVRERQRITIAAYNAGEGRIKSMIACADSLGINSEVWDSLKLAIPYMNNFKGTETVGYVGRVESLYDAFCRICPEKI